MPVSSSLRIDTHILIKLKRYEKPDAGYFENLALEVRRRMVESAPVECHEVEYLSAINESESQEAIA